MSHAFAREQRVPAGIKSRSLSTHSGQAGARLGRTAGHRYPRTGCPRQRASNWKCDMIWSMRCDVLTVMLAVACAGPPEEPPKSPPTANLAERPPAESPSPSPQQRAAQSMHGLAAVTWRETSPPPGPAAKPSPAQSAEAQAATAPSRPSFPTSVAGFTFGMSSTEVLSTCSGTGGGTLTYGSGAEANLAACDPAPVVLDFATPVAVVKLSAGRVTEVWLTARRSEDAIAAVRAKYGKEDETKTLDKNDLATLHAANPGSTAAIGDRTMRWWLRGGTIAMYAFAKKDTHIYYTSDLGKRTQDANY